MVEGRGRGFAPGGGGIGEGRGRGFAHGGRKGAGICSW